MSGSDGGKRASERASDEGSLHPCGGGAGGERKTLERAVAEIESGSLVPTSYIRCLHTGRYTAKVGIVPYCALLYFQGEPFHLSMTDKEEPSHSNFLK